MNYHFVLNNNFKKQTNQHIFLKKREKSNQKNQKNSYANCKSK